MPRKFYKKKRDKEDHEWDRKKWLKYHPEDKWIDEENMKARKTGYADDDVRQLFAAVCLRACIDYKRVTSGRRIKGEYPEETLDECEAFFKDEMFQFFVNRMPVEEVEKIIRATPENAIRNIWVKNEERQGLKTKD